MCKRIYKNGNIYTVEGIGWEERPVQAVAVDENGYIIATGSNDEVCDMADDNTEIIDMQGRTMLPGLIDSHVHMPGTAYADLFNISLFGITEKEDTLKAISEFIENHPDDKAYFGTGFNMGIVDESGVRPCAEWLDEICADKPIVLRSYDLHSSWINTKAMELSNITKETQEPPLGHIHRYEDGTPTGLFTDCQDLGIISAEYTHEQNVQAVKCFVEKMNQWGFTSITSIAPHMGLSPMIYKEIEASGELNLRVNTALFISPKSPEENLKELCTLRENLDTELIKVKTAKYLLDGVLEGNTAWLKEPYSPAAGLGDNYNSFPEWKMDDMKDSFREVMKEGFQIHVHSIGDAATSAVLDNQEAAMAEMADPERGKALRNVITHLQVVSPDDFERMAKLNNIAAIQTFWHLKEPGFFETVDLPALGEERVENEYPAKSFVNAGVKITNSGDYPVSSVNNPFCGIKAGVIRNLYSEEIFGIDIDNPDDERFLLNKDERLTVTEMIEAYTINGAYQMFREDEIGSIVTGKRADFIIIDRDMINCDVMDIDKTKVLETIFAGRTVYRA